MPSFLSFLSRCSSFCSFCRFKGHLQFSSIKDNRLKIAGSHRSDSLRQAGIASSSDRSAILTAVAKLKGKRICSMLCLCSFLLFVCLLPSPVVLFILIFSFRVLIPVCLFLLHCCLCCSWWSRRSSAGLCPSPSR